MIHTTRRPTRAELAELPVTHQATIDEEYLDFNRHMNVAWYLHLFNRATGGLSKWLEFDWAQLKSEGFSSFSLEGHVRYLSELLEGQRVTIRTRLLSRSMKRIHYLHFMVNDDGQALAATYEEVQAFIDLNARRMTEYPASISCRLDEVISVHQALPWTAPMCGSMQA